MKLVHVVAFIGLAWCGGLPEATASNVLFRFEEIKIGGDVVGKNLKNYISTSLNDVSERARLQKEFFRSYENLIKFKYDWMVNTLMISEHNPLTNILSAIVIKDRLDMKKMKEELDNVSVTFDTIQQLKSQYLTQKNYGIEIHRQHKEEVKKVKNHLLKQADSEISFYQTELWKEYFVEDIKAAIATAGNVRTDTAVVNQMSKKYPFRSWFAYLYKHPSHIPRRVCFESKPTASFTVGDQELFVIPGPLSISADQWNSARRMLGLIEKTDWSLSTRCDEMALRLYDEMQYTCSEGAKGPRHAFTAVLPYDSFHSSVTDYKLIAQKSVYRYSPVIRWCMRYYQVIVFA